MSADRFRQIAREYRVNSADWSREEIIEAIQSWTTSHGGSPPRAKDWADPEVWVLARRLSRRPDPREISRPSTNNVRARFGSWTNAIRAAGVDLSEPEESSGPRRFEPRSAGSRQVPRDAPAGSSSR